MKQFKDSAGTTWDVAVNVATVKRVRDLVRDAAGSPVDLLAVAGDGGGDLISRLSSDPVLLVDVLCALCRPQAEQRGVTDEQFAAVLVGEAIDAAVAALLDDLAAFFPLSRRGALTAAVGKVRQAEALAGRRATAAIEAVDVDSLLTKSGNSAGTSPASSASTPAP